jgi:carboxypeptidase family protein/carboxypeptidase-like protein/TonB-dependent receptor-like protein
MTGRNRLVRYSTRLAALLAAAVALPNGVDAQSGATALTSISGLVYDSLLTNAPVPGAEIIVSGVQRRVSTDARGRFRVDSVSVGSHEVTFSSARLDSLGLGTPVWTIDVPSRGIERLTLATPAARTVHTRLCRGADSTTALVAGRVRDALTGTALAGTRVTATWAEWIWDRGMVRRDRAVEAQTDDGGAYRLCNVPNDVPTAVQAVSGGHATGVVATFLDGNHVGFQNLTIATADSIGPASPTDSTSARRVYGSARLTGKITTKGRPTSGVRVQLLGTDTETRSDSAGNFTLVRLPGGSQTIQTLILGANPVRRTVDLIPNETLRIAIALDPNAVALAPVSVKGIASRNTQTGFDQRRKLGIGKFITRDEIDRRRPFDLTDMFFALPGVQVSNGQFGKVVRFGRAVGFGKNGNGCSPSLYLDGMRLVVDDYLPLDQWIRPTDVESVELYQGLVGVPPFARGMENICGVIVVWTRRS